MSIARCFRRITPVSVPGFLTALAVVLSSPTALAQQDPGALASARARQAEIDAQRERLQPFLRERLILGLTTEIPAWTLLGSEAGVDQAIGAPGVTARLGFGYLAGERWVAKVSKLAESDALRDGILAGFEFGGSLWLELERGPTTLSPDVADAWDPPGEAAVVIGLSPNFMAANDAVGGALQVRVGLQLYLVDQLALEAAVEPTVFYMAPEQGGLLLQTSFGLAAQL